MTDSAADSDTLRAVDLFCGAGGLSWGLVQALREVAVATDRPTDAVLEECIDLVGVNHWETAIQTHEANHPWARHFHDDVQNVNPREVFEARDPTVKILSGGIECTHWSTARGGKPVDDQKRMPAWDFLTWVQKLRPEHVLIENVREFADWGPIDDDGTPTRTGETFEQWVNALHSLGYSVDWDVLNAADYGDPTSRERLFVLASRDGSPTFPEPTHAEAPDPDDDREPWRTAAEVIDWSDPGGSIWTRDLHDARKHPLKNSTMQRIAEGIRRHCDDRLRPLADALAEVGRDDVKRLREHAVPATHARAAADVFDEPFLVGAAAPAAPTVTTPQVLGQHSNSVARAVTARPTPTVATAGKLQLAVPTAFCLRQQSGGVPAPVDGPLPTIAAQGAIGKVESRPLVMPRNGACRGLHSNPLYRPADRPLHTVTAPNTDGYLVTPSLIRYSHGGRALPVDAPVPTIACERGGVDALSTPYLCPLYNGRPGQRPRTRTLDRPLMTVPASKSPAGLAVPQVRPFLDDYEGPAKPIDTPLGTVTSRDRFALCVPECYPWGLDVRYRMLQPRELKRAQGFPDDYEILGTKQETTRQIGNAVPVTLAQRLVEGLLADRTSALTDYLDEDSATVDHGVGDAATGGAVGDD